jgi:hypothetical protein
MIDPQVKFILAPYEGEIAGRLAAGERMGDFEKMCEIVALARLRFNHRDLIRDNDVIIPVISLCGISWPGKTPSYREDAIRMRRDFRGIEANVRLQHRFGDSVTRQLLTAEVPDELNFSDLSRLYAIERVGMH